MTLVKRIIFLLLVLAAGWFFREKFTERFPTLAELGQELSEIKKTVNAPGPLRLETDSAVSFLTRSGVLKWTNEHRQHLTSALNRDIISLYVSSAV